MELSPLLEWEEGGWTVREHLEEYETWACTDGPELAGEDKFEQWTHLGLEGMSREATWSVAAKSVTVSPARGPWRVTPPCRLRARRFRPGPGAPWKRPAGWSPRSIAKAVQAIALADAQVKGAASDPIFALEKALATITAVRAAG